METQDNIKKITPVKTSNPLKPLAGAGVATTLAVDDSYTIELNISGRLSPNQGHPSAVHVPHGYGFYWLEAYNIGWTDNIHVDGGRPLEGFDFENKHQYIYAARRAQLVALAPPGYVAYDLDVDHSRGGTYHYENRSGVDWNLEFYLNDRVDYLNNTTDYYFDNAGSANCTFYIFRLPTE